MKVSVCFSTTNSLASRVIRWLTSSNVSHVYLKIFDQTLGTYMVLHSDWDGIQFDLFEKFSINNFTVEEFEIDDPRLDGAIQKNLWHLGKFYDYRKLISWAWLIMFKRWIVRKIKEPTKDPRKIICVDYILYVLNEANLTCLPIGHLVTADLLKWHRDNYENLGWKRTTFEENWPGWLKG